jgi:hypothetical protein
MTAPIETPRRSVLAAIPREIVSTAAFTTAIFLVVLSGGALVERMGHPNVWLTAAAYAGPSGLAFALYWWIARRL